MTLTIGDLRNCVEVIEEYYQMILEQPTKGLASRVVTAVVKAALRVVLALFNDLLEGRDEDEDGISPRELETTKEVMEGLMMLAEHLEDIGQISTQHYLELDEVVQELSHMCDALAKAHYQIQEEAAKQQDFDKKFEEIMKEQQ